MLVLSRKREEVIMLGDDIRITVVEVRGGKVRIGIEAPDEIPIHRLEVYRRIQDELRALPRVANPVEPPVPSAAPPVVS